MLLVILLIHGYISSELKGSTEGDQDPWFITCNIQCRIQSQCNISNNPFELDKPLALALTFWDCESECSYVCMRKHNQLRIDEGHPIVQYYGKWPFLRLFGFQELASSLFSIGNFIPHALAFYNYQREVPKSYYLRNVFLANALLGCFTWTFSTIFHCRDVTITELLDYSFASLTLLMGSYCATLRVFLNFAIMLFLVLHYSLFFG